MLQRFRKPLREFFERATPWLKKKWDDIAKWGKEKWKSAEDKFFRKYDEFLDWASARRNKEDLGGGLDAHEGRTTPGSSRTEGHTKSGHVGKSDQEMIDRANGEGGQRAKQTSSYPTQARAERAIAENIRDNEEQIRRWLDNAPPGDSTDFTARHEYPTGRHVPKRGTEASEVNGSKVVIVKDPSMPKGYRILTSHPTK